MEIFTQITVNNIADNELEQFHSILQEASHWLKNEGIEMWSENQLSNTNLLKKHSLEQMFMGQVDNEPAVVMILQEEDSTLWPNAKRNEAIYLHKLAVRRKFAKQGCSIRMINWAILHAKKLHKTYLRLDCAADRPKLCAFYENLGFVRVDERVMFKKYPTAFYELKID